MYVTGWSGVMATFWNERIGLRNLVLLTIGAAVVMVAYPDVITHLGGPRPVPYDSRDIPPAFSGNRAAYGFAFFSLFTITTLSIRKFIIITISLSRSDWRAMLDISLYRMAVASMCLVFVFRAAPDVLLMMVWGEISFDAAITLMTIDRVCDGLVIVPFLVGMTFIVRAEQLHMSPTARMKRERARSTFFEVVPEKQALRDHVRIIASVAIIAAGLAIMK